MHYFTLYIFETGGISR